LLLISFEFPYLRSYLFLPGLASEGHGLTGVTGGIVLGMGKNAAVPVSVWGDAEDLNRKTDQLKGKLAEACRAREVVEERFCRLMNSSSEGAWLLVASEVGHHEQFKELSLLRTWGVVLCLGILGPSPGRTPFPERMQTAALRHAGVARELAALQVAMSSTA
jgi:hypothetical protein